MSGQCANWGNFPWFAAKRPRRDDGSRRRKTAFRRGSAAVEFAMVAPLFFGLLFGIVEFGRAFMVQQILTNASREGARAAVLESATTGEVQAKVGQYLEIASIPAGVATVAVTVALSSGGESNVLSDAASGDPIEVQVAVNYEDISWIPSWFIPATTNSDYSEDGAGKTRLSATTIMLAERLQ